jgi:hypothetical protein
MNLSPEMFEQMAKMLPDEPEEEEPKPELPPPPTFTKEITREGSGDEVPELAARVVGMSTFPFVFWVLFVFLFVVYKCLGIFTLTPIVQLKSMKSKSNLFLVQRGRVFQCRFLMVRPPYLSNPLPRVRHG